MGVKNDTVFLVFTDSGLAVNHGGLSLSKLEPFAASGEIWNYKLD